MHLNTDVYLVDHSPGLNNLKASYTVKCPIKDGMPYLGLNQNFLRYLTEC